MELLQSFESMEEFDRLAVDIVIKVVPRPVVALRLIVVQRLIVAPQLIMVLVPAKLMLVQPMVELKHIMVKPKPIMVALVQLVRELDSSSNCIR